MDGTLDHPSAGRLSRRFKLRGGHLLVFLLGLLFVGFLFVFSNGAAWACENKTSIHSPAASAAIGSATSGGAFEKADASGSARIRAAVLITELMSSAHCCAASGFGPSCAGFHCASCALAGLPAEFVGSDEHARELPNPASQFVLASIGRSPDLRPPVSC